MFSQSKLPYRRPLAVGFGAVAAAVLVTACGGGSSSSSGSGAAASGGGQNSASGTTVSAHTMSGMGSVLTTSSGMTLYSPKQEANGTIQCTGSCTSFWLPLTVSKGSTPKASGTLTGKLGTVQRPDGSGTQVTYDGKPLYTFKLDSAPGQTHGNNYTDNFNGKTFNWNAVTSSGGAATGGGSGGGASPSSAPSYSYGSGGGGGGY